MSYNYCCKSRSICIITNSVTLISIAVNIDQCVSTQKSSIWLPKQPRAHFRKKTGIKEWPSTRSHDGNTLETTSMPGKKCMFDLRTTMCHSIRPVFLHLFLPSTNSKWSHFFFHMPGTELGYRSISIPPGNESTKKERACI